MSKPFSRSLRTKATMVVEVLRKLHMVRPSPAPARLVIAVAMERHETLCDLVEMCAELTELDHHQEYHYSCRSAQEPASHCLLKWCRTVEQSRSQIALIGSIAYI